MATFDERLRQLMKEKGFTQHKLAEAVDVSEPSVYSYYHGFTTPRLDVLVAIAKVFDVTTDYLLGLEDFNAKERFVNGIAVTKTGWDADDEICCPICGCSVARNDDFHEMRPKHCPDCGTKLLY